MNMNMLFAALGVLLLVCAKDKTPDKYRDFLRKVNEQRADFAKQFGIKCMHELAWSETLERDATASRFYGRRIVRFKSFESVDEELENLESVRKRINAQTDISSLSYQDKMYLELILTYHYRIGCSEISEGFQCMMLQETYFEPLKYMNGALCGCLYHYPIREKMCVDMGEPEEFAESLNDARREFAKRFNISNVREIYASPTMGAFSRYPDIEKLAKSSVFRPFQLKDYGIDKKEMKSEVDAFLMMSDSEKTVHVESPSPKKTKYVELMASAQDMVVCGWNMDSEFHDCLIGYQTSFEFWNTDVKSLDLPGSGCPEGYENNDGLCAPIDGHPAPALESVNSIRRVAAEKYGIPNMHGLVWNETLSQIASSLEWDTRTESLDSKNWPEAHISWRYTMSHNYRDLRPHAILSLMDWSAMSSSEKAKHIEGRSGTTLQGLELLEPRQRTIGCISKLYRNGYETNAYFCLVGPHGDFKGWEDGPKATSGPKCDNGYVISDGLCINIGNRTEFIKEMNEARRQFAKNHNVTNMHEMIWNEELAEIAKSQDVSEHISFKHGTHWRYVMLWNYREIQIHLQKEVQILKQMTSSNRDKKFERLHETSLGLSELLDPLQRFIGCAWKDQKVDRGLLCVIGPRGNTKIWKFENPPKIKVARNQMFDFIPGTNCSAGYENSAGLCTVAPDANITLFGNQEFFIKDLNEVRRAYAKQYNIENMHELIWNPDLGAMINLLDVDEHWPGARRTFRYANISSYTQGFFDGVDLKVEWIKGLSLAGKSKEKWRWLEQDEGTRGYLEFVEPRQYMIGCGEKSSKKDDGKPFIVCLLGPERKLQLWQLRGQLIYSLGAQCDQHKMGFENKDGLCAPGKKTKMDYFGNRRYFINEINTARRDRASFYRIPNYREIEWNPRLRKMAESFEWSSNPTPLLKNEGLRYFRLNSFNEWDWEHLVDRMIDHLEPPYTKNGQKVIEDRQKTTLDILEVFNRNNHLIGCAKRNTSSEFFLLCLTGPTSRYEFPLKGLFPEKPGGNCPEGTKNEKGLCKSVPRPKKTPPPPTAEPTTTEESTTSSERSQLQNPITMIALVFVIFYF